MPREYFLLENPAALIALSPMADQPPRQPRSGGMFVAQRVSAGVTPKLNLKVRFSGRHPSIVTIVMSKREGVPQFSVSY